MVVKAGEAIQNLKTGNLLGTLTFPRRAGRLE